MYGGLNLLERSHGSSDLRVEDMEVKRVREREGVSLWKLRSVREKS